MIETSTSKNPEYSIDHAALADAEEAQQMELFYKSIQMNLNHLVRDPAQSTIEEILTYSKNNR